MSRRFLRTAALGAVLALGLAGTALAVEKKWTGAIDNKWNEAGNWDNGVPTSDDTAIIEGTAVKVDSADATAKVVSLGQGATLSIESAGKLALAAGGALHASGDATVEVKAADGLEFTTATNIAVSPDKTLTLKRGSGTIKGAGDLTLTDKGTLVLEAPVTTVTDLKITQGGTLVVDVANALPVVAAPVTITKGNLTLNKGLNIGANKITVTEGVLTVAEGVKIGKNAPLDGEVDLKDKGHLVLSGDLTLKGLKTAEGSKITVNGKTLTVKPAAAFGLDAEIDKGTLSLDVTANNTAILSKDVENVVFNGKSGGAPTLKFAGGVSVANLDIRGSTTEPAKLQFAGVTGENTIGTLKFARTTPLVVSYSTLYVMVEKLILAGGAALDLELEGGTALTIKDGTPGAKWNVKMGNENTDFRVGSAGLLSGNVEVTLGGGTLYLPHGNYPNLTLKAESPSVMPTIDAEFFEGDPVLTVGKVAISNSNLRVKATGVWRHGLKAGDTLTLLEVNETALSDDKVIKGDPERNNDYWESKWERLEGNKTKLVLTASKDLTVPDLVAEASYSGNKCTVNVKVLGDVKVNEGSWNADMILGDRPENDPAYKAPKPETKTDKGAVFEVILPSGFTTGTLRVKATNKEGGNFQGFVDVPLERVTPGGGGGGGGGGGTPGTPGTPAAPSIDPSSWETTAIGEPDAQGNVTVELAATLSLEGTPKSLEVVASGMKEKPKAELLDAGGNVVVSSMPSVVGAGAKSYRLRLTCRTTKADIDAGRAAIEKVLVTTDDGKVHTINVNKKLKDIAKPGGNPEQPNPGNPGQPDNPGDSKSGSGGGCDAGFGGLALVFTAAFLLRRKA